MNLYASAAVCFVIYFWLCFSSRTLPAVTQWRSYGVTALLGLGCAIYIFPHSSFFIAMESLLASLIWFSLAYLLLIAEAGDRPSRLRKICAWGVGIALLVVTTAVVFLAGGEPALHGALAATVWILFGHVFAGNRKSTAIQLSI